MLILFNLLYREAVAAAVVVDMAVWEEVPHMVEWEEMVVEVTEVETTVVAVMAVAKEVNMVEVAETAVVDMEETKADMVEAVSMIFA